MERDFYVLIEKDENGFFVGEVPSLKACYSQGRTMDELLQNIREVIELCLESRNETESILEFTYLEFQPEIGFHMVCESGYNPKIRR